MSAHREVLLLAGYALFVVAGLLAGFAAGVWFGRRHPAPAYLEDVPGPGHGARGEPATPDFQGHETARLGHPDSAFWDDTVSNLELLVPRPETGMGDRAESERGPGRSPWLEATWLSLEARFPIPQEVA